jgi:hypothetical protein
MVSKNRSRWKERALMSLLAGGPSPLAATEHAAASQLAASRKWYYVIGTVAVFGLYLYSCARVIDLTVADLGRHVKSGEIIVNTGTIPRTNLFSYTHPDFPFVNHHWAAGVCYYVLHECAGFAGLRMLNVALELSTVGLLFGLAWHGTRFELAVFAAILAEPLIGCRGEVRPEYFSYFFTALFLVLLWQYRQKKLSGRWLWVLPVVELVWVNLHIFFPFGVLLVFLFLTDELFRADGERPRVRWLLAVGLACGVATLVNPWGIEGATYPLNILRNYGGVITENQPTWKYWTKVAEGPHFAFVFAVTIGAICWNLLLPERRDRQIALVLLFAFFSFLAWRYLRGITVFGFMVLVLIPFFLHRSVVCQILDRTRKDFVVLALVAFGTLYFVAYPYPWIYREAPGLGLEPGNLHALNFYRKNELRGPIFNTYNIGNYLIYGLYPEEGVFVDGRPEAYPASFFDENLIPLLSTTDNEDFWNGLSAKYGFNVVIMHTPETEQLPGYTAFFARRCVDPLWAIVYLDHRVVIIVRRTPANKAVIDRFEIDFRS